MGVLSIFHLLLQVVLRPLNNLKNEKEESNLKINDLKIRKREQEELEIVLKTDVGALEILVAEGGKALTALGDLRAR